MGRSGTVQEILTGLRNEFKWPSPPNVKTPKYASRGKLYGSPFDLLVDSTVRGWFKKQEDSRSVLRWQLTASGRAALQTAPERGNEDLTADSLLYPKQRRGKQALPFVDRHPDFCKVLCAKYKELRTRGVSLDSNILKSIALVLVERLQIDLGRFQFSRGWCRRFAKQYCGFVVRTGGTSEDQLPKDWERLVRASVLYAFCFMPIAVCSLPIGMCCVFLGAPVSCRKRSTFTAWQSPSR